ncbi:MAG: exodeoxyribonuclease VII large subunit [Chromatiales bacterium]|nr:exodeoxyribonuclease VII large subunit [Chromatiales bacterium]
MPSQSSSSRAGSGDERSIYSVSRLNAEVRQLLDNGMPALWIQGEISNLARPASGHLYLSLKDDRAQVRCAMWRQRSRGLGFQPRNGQQVIARAKVSLYEPRGEYQLIIEHMEEAGEGLLRQRLEELKARLDAEGLFDESRKRPLPALPRRIGIVTSPSGAAVRDVLKILRRRFPSVPALIYPVPVQGEGAAANIAEAIALANRRADCDVLIVTRGGGSLEDLWAFNEEPVARAIFNSAIPVISAVGHEVDVTIADLVADVRAPTPSGAAEIAVPDQHAWLGQLEQNMKRLASLAGRQQQRVAERLGFLAGRLKRQDPRQRLAQDSQRLDEMELRARRAVDAKTSGQRRELAALIARLAAASPAKQLQRQLVRKDDLSRRLYRAASQLIEARSQRLDGLARELNAISPLATLGRGYALVYDSKGNLIRDPDSVKPGDSIKARVADGHIHARVTATEKS